MEAVIGTTLEECSREVDDHGAEVVGAARR